MSAPAKAAIRLAFEAHPGGYSRDDGGIDGYCQLCGGSAKLAPDDTFTCAAGCDADEGAKANVDWYERTWLPSQENGRAPEYGKGWPVKLKKQGKGRRTIELADPPRSGDLPGLCRWLTGALHLNLQRPVVGGRHDGFGDGGLVELARAGAPALLFEPAGTLNTARTLRRSLSWQLLEDDDEPYAFQDVHAQRVAFVVRRLCGTSAHLTAAQDTAGIVGTFLSGAERFPEERTTYGTGGNRYEAARALQRELDPASGRALGPPRYLVDEATGELVIGVSDLQYAARQHTGSTVPRGWLDARMQNLGWQRAQLEGRGLPDDRGIRHHARMDVYRGHLPSPEDD